MKAFFTFLFGVLMLFVAAQPPVEKPPHDEVSFEYPTAIAASVTDLEAEITLQVCIDGADSLHAFTILPEGVNLAALDPGKPVIDYPPLASEKLLEGHRAREIYNSGAGGLAYLC